MYTYIYTYIYTHTRIHINTHTPIQYLCVYTYMCKTKK